MDTRLHVRVSGTDVLGQCAELVGQCLHGWFVKSAEVVLGNTGSVEVVMSGGDVEVTDDVVELLRSLVVGDDVLVEWTFWDRRSAPVSLAGLEL